MKGAGTDNQSATTHGAAGAERRLTTGADFLGIARDTEETITVELDRDGLAAMYKRRVLRLQTVSDLYFQAILGAQDMDKLDRYVQRYGWLQSSALRALVELHKLERDTKQESMNVMLGSAKDDTKD